MINWNKIELGFGIKIPDDYKIFIERNGSVNLNSFIYFLSPENLNLNLDLITQAVYYYNIYDDIKRDHPDQYSKDHRPFFPFAFSDTGSVISWEIVNGECRSVGVFDEPLDENIIISESFDEFLEKVFKNEDISIFPSDFNKSDKVILPN